MKSYKSEKIASQCVDILTKSTQKPIINISIATGKFIPAKGSGNFVNFFKTNGVPSKPENTSISNGVTTNSIDSKYENDVSNFEEIGHAPNAKSKCGNDLSNSEKIENVPVTQNPRKIIASLFSKQIEHREDDKTTNEPISPSSAILGSEQLKKALNRENLKNSFFMNFLKDAKPEVVHETSNGDLSTVEEDLPPTAVEPSPEKQNNSHEKVERVEEKTKIQEVNLLAQLQEIFPDLDDMDRSVVQLLPMELQRFANSYLKTKSSQKVQQPVKNVAKVVKSKSAKTKVTPKANSLQNFFVKTGTTSIDESNRRKCSECNQMIETEKYAEHLDFHVAKNLQRAMNRVDSSSSSVESSSFKRRRSDDSSGVSTKKVKGISTFFG